MNAPGGSAEFDFRAGRAFPVTAVAGDGRLTGSTVTMLLVTMLAG